MSSWLLGIVLGIVQGVSEWLPVSSKTQVIIASTYLFGLTFNEAYALGLFLEAGTFIAASYYFRHEVWKVLLALVGKGDEEGRLLLKFLLVVTVFTGVIGVALYATVQSVTGPALGLPMVVLGCILIGDGLLITYAKGRYIPTKALRDLSMKELVLLGVIQGISALPGVSRSGVTVSAMLLLGINPRDAFRLSFLALIPASIGAAGVTVLFSDVSVAGAVASVTPQVIVLAVIVSVVIGIAFIGFLLRVAGSRRIALLTFALGVLALASGVVSIATGISG
ncbi:MAG: undecaprenyl-diphosphate phosphatase [Nitrososphaerota archaeon]|nr:undecaprenyl-diphosphate phosphatase [Nitrososphaerota archaeon]